MNRNKIIYILLLLFSFSGILISFQNCGQKKFVLADDKIASFGDPVTTTFVTTQMNVPVSFIANHTIDYKNITLTIDTSTPENGSFAVEDLATIKIKYSPAFGFRGRQEAVATIRDSYGDQQTLKIIVDVGATLSTIQPSLAVRGMGCIQCHSNVASNIVTDFGSQGNGQGFDYTFGVSPKGNHWAGGSPYGDHGQSFNTLNMGANTSVFVPQNEAVPTVVHNATGFNTLAEYIRDQFSKSANAGTKVTPVVEKSKIYIGAPEVNTILNAFHFTSSQRHRYFRETNTAVALSGLKDEGTFFRNDGPLSCEGDLALRGPLYLDNLSLQSKTGCRIYVMGSVFIYGPINYLNKDGNYNLQITSSKAIAMGLGAAKKNGSYCESTSRWAQNSNAADYAAGSSLKTRFTDIWTTPYSFIRSSQDPKAYGQSVVDDAALIEAKAGPLYDAACRSEGREVSFERLLLNAPIIHGRYTGDFKGTLIGEYVLMSLGGLFHFEFDPIFSEVTVLPFIESTNYLDVE
ncbi:MAG: hypothetical protein H6623_05750 [Bdellovibrionaceae bacterium]|nr:hypothetical protein [Pseudobdellovibrionaceae bacterium]